MFGCNHFLINNLNSFNFQLKNSSKKNYSKKINNKTKAVFETRKQFEIHPDINIIERTLLDKFIRRKVHKNIRKYRYHTRNHRNKPKTQTSQKEDVYM